MSYNYLSDFYVSDFKGFTLILTSKVCMHIYIYIYIYVMFIPLKKKSIAVTNAMNHGPVPCVGKRQSSQLFCVLNLEVR